MLPPELVAEMTPVMQAFVEPLLARIEQSEAENCQLRERLKKLERFDRFGSDSSGENSPPADAGASTGPANRSTKAPRRKRGTPSADHLPQVAQRLAESVAVRSSR